MPDGRAEAAEDRRRLDALYLRLREAAARNIGYPCNQRFDYGPLFRFLELAANNVGDPFAGSNYSQNTHDLEREVVASFARFSRAEPDELWGYVTGGGTEGNMYGLYLARELYPEGMVYFSEDSHYSVPKILRLQHTRNIMIRSLPNGEIDCDDLRETVFLRRDVPPIIFANIGTTMKGAVDDLGRIREIMQELAVRNYYVHCDAALSGAILPFVENAPPWDFADGADSIAVSGHKFLGCPLPCGVVLARKKHVERVARSVEYVGVLDTTISGSRSAITPLMLWYRLRELGEEGLRQLVRRCLERAGYAVERFRQQGISAWRHTNSVTVVLPRPPESLVRRWSLAPQGAICHLITLDHVTEEIIDEFVSEYVEAMAAQRIPAETVPVAKPADLFPR